MTDQAVDAYALFRRCYKQRVKPWEDLSDYEQEGWREFFEAAARTIRAQATAAERERIIRLATQLRASIPADHPEGAQASFADYLRVTPAGPFAPWREGEDTP